MGNAVIAAKAPATGIAGALSDGILIQNLSTFAPLYLGYDPSVNSNSFSGFVAAGGSYTTPKGKDVYLYADADCSVVYDFTPDASPGAGSGVIATATQSYTSLYGATVPLEPNAQFVLLNNIDVSRFQTLILSIRQDNYGGNTPGQGLFVKQGMVAVRVSWYSREGADLAGESFLFCPYGNGQVRLPVKGPIARVRVQTDQYTPTGWAGVFTVTASTGVLGREYASRPFGVGKLEGSGSVVWEAAPADLGYVQSISFSTSGNAWYALPSYMGRANFAWNITGGSFAIHAGLFGLDSGKYYTLFYSTATGDQSKELIIPGSPLWVELNGNASVRMTAAYELAA